jgi:hypothetical protein
MPILLYDAGTPISHAFSWDHAEMGGIAIGTSAQSKAPLAFPSVKSAKKVLSM